MSTSGPPWAKKLASTGPTSSPVEVRVEGVRIEAGRGQAGLPDRHPAAVGDDRDAVGGSPERGGRHPGQASVGQQHGREQDVGDQHQPQPQAVRDGAGRQRGIEPEASCCGDEQERQPAQADVYQVPELAAGEQAEGQPQEDAERGHGSDGGGTRTGRIGHSPGTSPGAAAAASFDPGAPVVSAFARPTVAIDPAAWPISGTSLASGRPGSRTSRAHFVRTNAIHDIWIELNPAELVQLGQRLLEREWGHAVRSSRSHRLERVGDVQDSCQLGISSPTRRSG